MGIIPLGILRLDLLRGIDFQKLHIGLSCELKKILEMRQGC
ncbi:hypothetical protein pb186bvf_016569 [Paramecium bursaria]